MKLLVDYIIEDLKYKTFTEYINKEIEFNFEELKRVQKGKRARIFSEDEIKKASKRFLKYLMKNKEVKISDKYESKYYITVPDNYLKQGYPMGTVVTFRYENGKIKINYERKQVQTCGTLARYQQLKRVDILTEAIKIK